MRKLIKLLIGITVVGVIIIWWSGSKKKNSETTQSQTIKTISDSTAQQVEQSTSSIAHNVLLVPHDKPLSTLRTNVGKPTAEELAEMQYSNPIEFYGKVVNENEQGVSGATIEFELSDAKGTDKHLSTVSDNLGLFSISGIKGKWLNVHVSKNGYYNSKTDQSGFDYYIYDAKVFRPDSTSPVLFHLKQKGQIEPLIAHHVLLRIPQNGGSIGFDPSRCKLNTIGPLLFSLTMDDSDGRQNVRLRLAVEGGGIQMTENEFAFTAPTSNYMQSVEIVLNKDYLRESTARTVQCFFFLGNSRQYGRLQVEVPIFNKGDTSPLSINYWLNLSGSLNLEDDPNRFMQSVSPYYLQPNTPPVDSMH